MKALKILYTKLAFSWVLIFLFTGCSVKYPLAYVRSNNQTKLFNSSVAKVYIYPFQDKRANPNELTIRGFAGSANSYASEVPLKNIVYQGIKQELKQKGLTLANTLEESNGYIKGTLNAFEFSMATSGNKSARTSLDIQVYSVKGQKLKWEGTTEAFSMDHIQSFGESFVHSPERVMNGVINKLIQRAVNNPDFQDALFKLSS